MKVAILVLSDEPDPYLGKAIGYGGGDGYSSGGGDGYGYGSGFGDDYCYCYGYGYGDSWGSSDGIGGIKQNEDSNS